MEGELTGRVALVTGGSRGIGRAIALALARVGADVAVNYRERREEAEEVCARIRGMGRRSIAVQGNVALAADVERLVAKTRRELGVIGILVNNAGIAQRSSMEEITVGEWDRTLEVNLRGVFLVTQAVLPDMRAAGWGRIISLSSVAAHMGGSVGPHYAASKAGIIGLTHYYATHLVREGITANAIAPGPTDTDMIASLPQVKPEQIPVGRFGTAEEIAMAAVMLARNAFITGQTINVNGGRYPT